MIRIALIGDIGSGKVIFQNYSITLFLMQILRYQKFIKKIENILKISKKNFQISNLVFQ